MSPPPEIPPPKLGAHLRPAWIVLREKGGKLRECYVFVGVDTTQKPDFNLQNVACFKCELWEAIKVPNILKLV